MKAASLNHHDVWSMRGVGVRPEQLPIVLGSDGAGVDEAGREVIVYPVLAADDQEMLLSDGGVDGTFAEVVRVPRANLIPKPDGLSWHAAASLGTAWLTAYRMLFTVAAPPPGSTVLVQGAGGGLATALIRLGTAAGLRMWVTSRSAEKRERAVAELGADAAFEPGARLPERVDAVMESVGEPTWEHSLKCVRRGGTIVVAGATGGALARTDLMRVFLTNVTITGCTMGTADELRRLVALRVTRGVEPVIDSVFPLAEARSGIARIVAGDVFGKVVFDVAG
jgi:NADPH:quinone reductase-like Zn-dependent oxidoreductase